MKPVSDQLFAFDHPGTPGLSHERCSAADLGVKESWLRDAIFAVPELVIGPCRAAGLTDDESREVGSDLCYTLTLAGDDYTGCSGSAKR